jgi:hypothetical protein
MSSPRPGWSGFLAGLPAGPAPEPPAPQRPQPDQHTMPNVHQGARAPMPVDEGTQLAAVMRQAFPGFGR